MAFELIGDNAQPREKMLCTEIVSDIQNNFCPKHVLPCSAKRRASDKDLPVSKKSDHKMC